MRVRIVAVGSAHVCECGEGRTGCDVSQQQQVGSAALPLLFLPLCRSPPLLLRPLLHDRRRFTTGTSCRKFDEKRDEDVA